MKKLFALVLSVVMLVGLLPVSALAVETVTDVVVDDVLVPELAMWLADGNLGSSVRVPDGSAYYVAEGRWERKVNDAWQSADNSTCNKGDIIRCVVKVVAGDDAVFAAGDALQCKINGETVQPIERSDTELVFAVENNIAVGWETIEGNVELTGELPELAVGDTMGDVEISPVDSNAPYAVDRVVWWDGDNNVVTGQTVQEGKIYTLMIAVKAKDGYNFNSNSMYIDGENAGIGYSTDDFGNALVLETTKTYSFATEINKVEVSYAEPEVGKAAPVVKLPDEAPYILDHYVWYDAETGDEVTGVLADKKTYEMFACVIPKEGYAFSNNLKIFCNGEKMEGFPFDMMWVNVSDRISFCEEIDTVEIMLPEPEAGKAGPAASVPEDAHYTLQGTDWYKVVDWELAAELVKGERYEADIWLQVEPGYIFSEDLEVFVNGEETNSWHNGSVVDLNVYSYHSLNDVIKEVEITLPMPELGAAFSGEQPKLPEGAKYQVEDFDGWYNANGDELAAGDKFENENSYDAMIVLKSDEYFEFGEETVVKLNGEILESDYYPAEGMLYINLHVSYLKPFEKVELPAWPELQAGDKFPSSEPVETEDGKYEYYMYWIRLDEDMGGWEVGDTVEDGELYIGMMIANMLDEKSEFTADTAITVDGKPMSALYTDVMGKDISVFRFYNFNKDITVIDKIELFAEMPKAGEKGGPITAPEGALYHLELPEWGVSPDESYDKLKAQDGAFKAGEYAWIFADVVAEEGCLIAFDAEVYLNGEKIELIPNDTVFYDDVEMNRIAPGYNMGQVKAPVVEEPPVQEPPVVEPPVAEEPDKVAPPTGDSASLLLWTAMLSVSAAAVYVLQKKRCAK